MLQWKSNVPVLFGTNRIRVTSLQSNCSATFFDDAVGTLKKLRAGSTSKKRDPPSVPARAGKGEEDLGAAPDERERSLIKQKSTAVLNWHRLKYPLGALRGISGTKIPESNGPR
jgi:hypothetical protein